MKIGVIDSGIGGVAVLKELFKLPGAYRYIYYSDNRNAPYGSLNAEDLKKRVVALGETLRSLGAEILLLLCNTATTVALREARETLGVPVFGVRPVPSGEEGKTLVLSTMLTAKRLLAEKTFSRDAILGLRSLSEEIETAAPDFSTLKPYLKTLLAPYADVKTVFLACTHYLHLAPYIAELLPSARLETGIAPLEAAFAAELGRFRVAPGVPTAEFIFSGEDREAVYRSVLTGEECRKRERGAPERE